MTLSTAIAPLEKIALETYVPLAKPSLIATAGELHDELLAILRGGEAAARP